MLYPIQHQNVLKGSCSVCGGEIAYSTEQNPLNCLHDVCSFQCATVAVERRDAFLSNELEFVNARLEEMMRCSPASWTP